MCLFLVTTANIAINDREKTRFFGLYFCHRLHRSVFDHFDLINPKATEFGQNTHKITAITPFKVIQGHRFWYQSKAHMRLPISD